MLHNAIGLYRENAIAIESEARDPKVVMCNTSQCKLRSPFRNLRVMNIICIVTHYTIPPFGSLDSFWIMRSQRSRRRDKGLWGLGVYVSAHISVTKEHAPTLISL